MPGTNPNSNPAADPSTDHTGKIAKDIKSTLHGIRGAGDAIRGTAMEAVDAAAHSKEGEARNRAIAEKGAVDVKSADQRFGERRAEHHTVGPAAGTHDAGHGAMGTATGGLPATAGGQTGAGGAGGVHGVPERTI